VQALALAEGLARAGTDLAVMRPAELHPTVATRVGSLATEIRFEERDRLGRPDVFHRPFQIASLHDLADRLAIGERFVLTHQDMIWDRTRAYHADAARRDYRIATSAALSAADEVGFFSVHAAVDAASEGALDPDRATVVPLGVDHLTGRDVEDTVARPLAGRPFLLMVGTSFWHKNRVFALRLLRWLIEARGWDGGLVLVGGHHEPTSSRPAEALFLEHAPSLAGRVVDLGHVPEAEQLALYRDAELVLFPSLYEGFGFIPFEAAALGTACVYADRPAMNEHLPTAGALPSFDLEEAGGFVLGLLESPEGRADLVEAISGAAKGLTWDRTAAGYLEVYGRALGRPRSALGDLVRASIAVAGPAASAREASLLGAYRRRRSVRVAFDAALWAHAVVGRGLRRIRRHRPSDR
jgi:glycosyltransferase involved in cell wall biosynthesis